MIDDVKYKDAIDLVVSSGMASTSLLQRKLKLGYAEASEYIDKMEVDGIIGPYCGTSPRVVLTTAEQWSQAQAVVNKQLSRRSFWRSVFPKGAIITLASVTAAFIYAYIKAFPMVPESERKMFYWSFPVVLIFGLLCILAVYHVVTFFYRRSAGYARARTLGVDKLIRSGTADYDNMDGATFEQFCARLLVANGYTDVRVVGQSGDYGVDVLASKDDVTFAIQCKCYSSNIGNEAVQQVYSGKSHHRAMVGAVMTNRYFTPQAITTAEEHGVLLWNRDKLNEMIQNARGVMS